MRSRLFSLIFPMLLALAAPAWARETLDSILPQIRAAHPGRLSDAEPFVDSDGRTHYRIKWMTPEGRILYFDADAQTGRYSNSGGDNGGQWHGGSDNHGYEGEHRRDRDNWNGGGSDGYGGGGDWRDHEGGGGEGRRGGDWRDHEGGGPRPGGDWGDRRGRGGPPGDWGGRGGDWGGRGGDWGHGGGWRGGRGGGNNGGWGHGHGGH